MNLFPLPRHVAPFGLAVLVFLLCVAEIRAAAPGGNLTLPEKDSHWLPVKDYIEAQPIPEYRHASAEAYEAFRDIKYGVRIHWGLYSILGKPSES